MVYRVWLFSCQVSKPRCATSSSYHMWMVTGVVARVLDKNLGCSIFPLSLLPPPLELFLVLACLAPLFSWIESWMLHWSPRSPWGACWRDRCKQIKDQSSSTLSSPFSHREFHPVPSPGEDHLPSGTKDGLQLIFIISFLFIIHP